MVLPLNSVADDVKISWGQFDFEICRNPQRLDNLRNELYSENVQLRLFLVCLLHCQQIQSPQK